MSKIRQLMKIGLPVQPGDLAINWRDWREDYEDHKEFVERITEDIQEYPSANDYIYPLKVEEITKFEKGRFYIKSPHMPLHERSRTNWTYNKDSIKPFDKALFQRLMEAFPLKAKVGDKIINPYLKMKDQDIIDGKEEDYEIYGYGVDALKTNIDLDGKRPYYAKMLPYLEINHIYSEVLYNIKYNNYLFTINHYFDMIMKNDDIQIYATLENDALQHYESFNGIWNTVCMSPSQET